ncbi:hypothetical protein [Campylobacter troglodytis]|uniref:hypothetical protein n=1 Tax=Campylobacter troglodytis TaxID=654363 RepID=UPI00163C2234|nr:hypothetical protein [Campylobacter troglodytis]
MQEKLGFVGKTLFARKAMFCARHFVFFKQLHLWEKLRFIKQLHLQKPLRSTKEASF